MRAVFGALREMVDQEPDIEVVYPVHLSPAVQEGGNDLLGNHERIHLIEPLDVFDFHNLASRSYFIMSDSGGCPGRGSIIRKTSIGIARYNRTPRRVFKQEL